MVNNAKCVGSGLFRSVSMDGAHWLLAILPNDGWAITRDGEPVAAGTARHASLDAGVRKFMALTLTPSDPGCRLRPESLNTRSG